MQVESGTVKNSRNIEKIAATFNCALFLPIYFKGGDADP
jgi:hypothetical protein